MEQGVTVSVRCVVQGGTTRVERVVIAPSAALEELQDVLRTNLGIEAATVVLSLEGRDLA
jgi:hypothetical protein